MARSIDPTPESVRQLAANLPSGTPVVMLNLLRFRAQAAYAADRQQPARSGREAYATYAAEVVPHLKQVGGTVIWQGEARHAFIAPPDERWDEVLLVEYPSKEAFLSMLKSPAYQEITFHRTAALEDARLIATIRQQ
ncbi:MAG TPA: DUF1330 domain-containing protein [Noviherbaspirillum sp.]|uniref:DUF1330 domain-containing protein n=1 Tax=Noviherbaspirillum sp. TaxID=1926288 RepID=UPI002D29488C|nr:DUF1330 domain-containing protein [Noviherbaspirillum sp.]HYD94941.1 DUF1330 domain-containing protein [Noviherbaspirillum sp.]